MSMDMGVESGSMEVPELAWFSSASISEVGWVMCISAGMADICPEAERQTNAAPKRAQVAFKVEFMGFPVVANPGRERGEAVAFRRQQATGESDS